MPAMNRIGMKTAASEIVIDRIVNQISREPRSAASIGDSPCSMWRTMFSSMTIASSTTNPTDRISAIIEMLFRLKPRRVDHRRAVPSSEKGSASEGISVADPLRRNSAMTRITMRW